MDYRNKLGTFTFDENVQPSLMKLVVQTVTGQYLNPKQGEPTLTDEDSCLAYIREGSGAVLAAIGFDLVINEDVKRYTPEQARAKKIRDFDERIMTAYNKKDLQDLDDLLDGKVPVKTFGGWLVGPAAVR